MKRIWIGIGLLIGLLVGGIWSAKFMEDNQRLCAGDLRRASGLVLEEDWPLAEALTKRAEDRWEKKRHVTASLADHGQMDEIDGFFARLKVYGAAHDAVSYSGTCAHLAQLMEALGESHSFLWWNLL